MRRFGVGVLVIAVLAGTLTAWALQVKLPNKAVKAKVMLLVDELGNTLFATAPGRVEVTGRVQADVIMPPTDCGPEPKFVSFYIRDDTLGEKVIHVFTVPRDTDLIITDIETVSNSSGGRLSLEDSSGPLFMTIIRSLDTRSYQSGIVVEGGELLQLRLSGAGRKDVTLMGRLVPVSDIERPNNNEHLAVAPPT